MSEGNVKEKKERSYFISKNGVLNPLFLEAEFFCCAEITEGFFPKIAGLPDDENSFLNSKAAS